MKGSKLQRKINPNKIRQARLARGYTIREMAEEVGVTKQAISQFELGKSIPKTEIFMRIVNMLNFPRSYFYQNDTNPAKMSNTFFRSRKSTSKKSKEMQMIRLEWLSNIYDYLADFIEFPELNLPDTSKFNGLEWTEETIEQLSIRVRNYWRLGNKPIIDMVSLLEANGVIVSSLQINNAKIDAFFQRVDEKTMVLLNNKSSAVRRQFDAAHELGHILMHDWVDDQEQLTKEEFDEMEAQANYFASSLLLPVESFSDSLIQTSLDYYKELKKYWFVSIAAMIRRSKDLGLISYNQYSYLNRQLSSNKMRKKEPLDDVLKLPQPNMLREAVELVLKHNLKDETDIVNDLKLPQAEIEILCNIKEGRLNPKTVGISLSLKDH